MTTIGGVGIGFYLLGIVWILAIIFFVITIPLESNLGWVGLTAATIFTILLVLIPTEINRGIESDLGPEKDYSHIYRYILLATLITCVCISFFIIFTLYCINPVRPKAIPSF